MELKKIEQLIKRQQLTLLRNALQGNSRARTFYMGMMKLYNQGNIDQYPASLLSRCKKICDSEQFSLYKYIFNDKYQTRCKRKLKTIKQQTPFMFIMNKRGPSIEKEMIDSVKCLLQINKN